jgi:hypothetical protein
MKALLGKVMLIVVSLMVACGFGEVVLRQVVPLPPPKYEDVLRVALDQPERLFVANQTASYDIKGLYEGADTIRLRVSKNRFIEPEPEGPYKHRVLFLGGSTTEALYVPEEERWVALLNEPGHLAAYNAGQSGANSIDKYFTFEYLTKKGMKFDLVVLATGYNDLPWVSSFQKYGHRFIVEEYKQGLHDYIVGELGSNLTLDDWLRRRSIVYFLTAQATQSLWARATHSNTQPAVHNVTEVYVNMREVAMRGFIDEKRPPGVNLMDRYPSLDRVMQEYRANAVHNLAMINKTVQNAGGKLLVVTEATSWMAPSSSFHNDLRIPSGMFSYEDLHETARLRDRLFLEAAKEAGALTFDLAADVGLYSNGPEGGRYMYDSMHFTPEGCKVAAAILSPVLHRILEGER